MSCICTAFYYQAYHITGLVGSTSYVSFILSTKVKVLLPLAFHYAQSFPLKLVSSASACHMKRRLWFTPPLSMGPNSPPQPPPPEDYGYQIPPPEWQRFQAQLH